MSKHKRFNIMVFIFKEYRSCKMCDAKLDHTEHTDEDLYFAPCRWGLDAFREADVLSMIRKIEPRTLFKYKW